MKFDFIDTSNLADDLGLIPLVVHCQQRLKSSGVMRTESNDWLKTKKSPSQFLRRCIDISPLMYPTILGVHLAEELDLGQESLSEEGSFVGCGRLSLRWKKARTTDKLDTVGSSDGVSMFLTELETQKYSVEDSVDFFVYKNVRVVRFDQRTKVQLKARLDDMMTANQASVSTKTSEKVIEYNDRFELYLMPAVDVLPKNWSCTYKESDVHAVVISTTVDDEPQISYILEFSCAVSLHSKQINVSPENGFVQITLYKCHDLTVGERVLPWKQLDISDVSSLQDYPKTTFWIQHLQSHIIISHPMWGQPLATDVPFPEPRHQLKDLFELFLRSIPVIEKIKTVYVPRNVNSADPLKAYHCAYSVDGFKLWDGKPALFLTWYRFDKALELLPIEQLQKINLQQELGYTGLYVRTIPFLQKLAKGYDLFTSILDVNSYRLRQIQPEHERWKIKTFVRGRYPFELLKEEEFHLNLQQQLGLRGPVEETEMVRRKVLGIQALGLQDFMFTPMGKELLSSVEEDNLPVCDSCGKRSSECKKCSACKIAFYCDRACQLAAWSRHKKVCKNLKKRL